MRFPRRQSLLLNFIFSAILAITSFSCFDQSKGKFDGLDPLSGDTASSEFLEEPIQYCRDDGTAVETRTQILLDASGSMAGFEPSVPGLVAWFQQSLSRIRGVTAEIADGRTCSFSEGLGGVGDCQDLFRQMATFDATTNTTLDQAILSARQYDLSVILTDGVAFSPGTGSDGDCARGVDSACVARSFRSVVTSQDIESKSDWGLWVVPLVAQFAGPYYTEQPIPKEAFDSRQTTGNVTAEFGGEPRILNPRINKDGTLVFDYSGLRSLVLFVLARDSSVGRSLVEALMERSDQNRIHRASHLSNASHDKVTALKALEVFPGYLNKFSWKDAQASTTIPMKGTIDVQFRKPLLKASCPINGSGETYVELFGEVPNRSKSAGCVEILQLPAMQRTYRSARVDQQASLQSILPSYAPRTQDPPQFTLQIHCGPEVDISCEDPVGTQWRVRMDYARAADCLAENCDAAVARNVLDISTVDPSTHPHKIFGLADILKEFYRQGAGDDVSQLVASLDICRSE